MPFWIKPLGPTEISWILEGKIRGTIPLRLFPRPEDDSPEQQSRTALPVDDPPNVVDSVKHTEIVPAEKVVKYSG